MSSSFWSSLRIRPNGIKGVDPGVVLIVSVINECGPSVDVGLELCEVSISDELGKFSI